MDIFKEIEKWKREHRDEWKQIEDTLRILDELGLRKKLGPEPLRPGFEYEYEVSDSGTYNFRI